MSITDIASAGWAGFWANLTAPATLSIFAAVILLGLFVGLAFHCLWRAMKIALRCCALIFAVIIVVNFLSALGVLVPTDLGPVVDWLLGIVHAPIYVPEAA